jgi:hypothetical protein
MEIKEREAKRFNQEIERGGGEDEALRLLIICNCNERVRNGKKTI